MSELPPWSRSLFDAARADEPPPGSRDRVRARVASLAARPEPSTVDNGLDLRSVVLGIFVGVIAVAALATLVFELTGSVPRSSRVIDTTRDAEVRVDGRHVVPAAPPIGRITEAPSMRVVASPRPIAPPPARPTRSAPRPPPRPPTIAPITLVAPGADEPTGVLLMSTMPASLCTVPGHGTRGTPFRMRLPPGSYAVRCVNDTLNSVGSYTVTIVAGETADFRFRPLE